MCRKDDRKKYKSNNEFYVCLFYNQLIEEGGKVRTKDISKMWD